MFRAYESITAYLQVFISWALMEVSVLGGGEDEDGNEIEGEEGDPDVAREVFERGYKDLRKRGEKEDVSDLGDRREAQY